MIKNPFSSGGFVLPFRNGGGGGGMQSLSGGTSLATALAAVDRAEQALEAARAQARAAAKREGKGVRNLFADGAFVARASAEKWCDQARSEGVKAGCNLIISSLNMDPSPPFQHLVARLKRPGAMEAQRATWAKMRAAGFDDALDAGDLDEAARIVAKLHREEVLSGSKGAAIVAAGQRARMSGDRERPEPEKGTLASQILAAGRKRRGEDR